MYIYTTLQSNKNLRDSYFWKSSIPIIFRIEILSVRYFCPSNLLPPTFAGIAEILNHWQRFNIKRNGLEFGLTMILSNLYQHITRVIKSSNIVKASSGLLSTEVLLTRGK